MIIYPQKITKGDKIGVTATSMGFTSKNYQDRLDNAYVNLKELGYDCIETSNVRTNEKLVSSSPSIRAKEFLELWKNNKITWIVQSYGGEFLMEILPFIDGDIIKNNMPKWVSRIF